MKLSQISYEEMLNLSNEDREKIVYGGLPSGMPKESDIAILLGGPSYSIKERALAAAKLYNEKKVKYIIPTGKPKWDSEFGKLSECDIMIKYLRANGVPKKAIIPERQALTTEENMIFACLQIARKIKFTEIKSVTIVTSPDHLKRSMAYAKMYFPSSIEILGYQSDEKDAKIGKWQDSEIFSKNIKDETRYLWWKAVHNLIDDIEF